ncbi:MAG: nuclear transport factor 2 family protein [Actinomycetota bacterium]|nr:nuclear transport factor 2 family protein [Actinomycetota bacterium]
MIGEHQQVAPDATSIEDIDAITRALQLYIDGVARGDHAKLVEAFHPDARMYGAIGARRFDMPITEFAKVATDSPADVAGTFHARITSVVQTGDVACATVVEEGFWGTVSFVDFLSLCRIEDRWRIVNKTFAHTGGEPPAPQ